MHALVYALFQSAPGYATCNMQCMIWWTSVYACGCSVLEPGRTLTLAEKAGAGAEVIRAAPGFCLVATMNPGGDYGKKELSPALSNRLTQIWVPAIEDEAELAAIIHSRITGIISASPPVLLSTSA